MSSSQLHLPRRPRRGRRDEHDVVQGDHRARPRAPGRLQARSRSTPPASPTSTPPTAPGSSARTASPRRCRSAPGDDGAADGGEPARGRPGAPLTFSGSADDDQNLRVVEITLRNSTTRENLASDGTWGIDSIAGWYRISPAQHDRHQLQLDLHDAVQPQAGQLLVPVRATDDLGLTTSSTNQGKLTINAQVPGDAPPDGKLNVTGTVTGGQSLHLDLAGTATDDKGVKAVRVSLVRRRHQPVPPGQRHARRGVRHPHGHAGARPTATSTTWTLPGRPAPGRRLERHGLRLRHRRPAGHLDLGGHGSLPDLPR